MPEPIPMHAEAQPPARRRFRACWLLLILPYAGLLFPVIYARATPTLFGFPFFYWYQCAWVVLTSALLWMYYRMKTVESS